MLRMVSSRLLVLLAVVSVSVACEETRCRTLQAHAVDEGQGCLGPAIDIPALRACGPYPPSRGIRVFCLVDDRAELYLAGGGDSELLSGSGYRYTGGTGRNALSGADIARCEAAIEKIWDPQPAKICSS